MKTIDLKWLRKKLDDTVERDDKPRTYLGASGLGDDCQRKVFYQFRHMFTDIPEPRLQRLFGRGHREEPVFIAALERCGIIVHTEDPETGEQYRVTDFEQHFGGSLDAVLEFPPGIFCDIPPALAEFKTYNDSRFQTLRKEGVRISDPKYYKQMQLYMGYMELTWALFCAVNKNDDELYFEVVMFNRAEFEKMQNLAGVIIMARKPLPRLSDQPTFWKCKWCKASAICHKKAAPEKNCRSCQHAFPDVGGKWSCDLKVEFGVVCDKYKAIV